MKFENVKVGDTVMIEECISVSFWGRDKKIFTIPKKIEKVTRTQFTVNGCRFKKNGVGIGDESRFKSVYFLGDKRLYSNETITDQTEEMNLLKNKMKLERQISKKIESLKIGVNDRFSIEELYIIDNKISKIVELMK